MHILLVHVHVKPESIDAFKAATIHNASNSIKEAGVVRFDFLQQAEDPSRFTLVEVYYGPDDHARHRETQHYQTWRDTVTEMMTEPRLGIRYTNILPVDADWKK